ncbi:hypothetical protein CAEBREN_03172 [Caenorhabditis brenneri]|uniref:Uncharacterized protein n=1 Tax=Caenorhabditis brenneri TaxID=135651 RepID=G0NFN9_CAEBE|nr:hypothetical protein CAEBREN_03172 [Caenorhabditis brenneri]
MVLSKLFSSSRSRDKELEKKYIIKGYPLTTSPVVPDILKHQVEFKKVKYGSIDLLGLTFAHEGSDLVKPESLELFRNKLEKWYKSNPKFLEQISSKFPKNLIAISAARPSFDVGESCHEFKLRSQFKPSENSYFTYRKHSECIQCAYYNEDGVEFLAGITFYPAPHGKPQLLKSNDALLYLASGSYIRYPLEDRLKSFLMTEYKQYGRFCSVAGRHVLLTCSRNDRAPRHCEYNHVIKEYEYIFCDECCRDHYTYEWEEPKKDTPATAAPIFTVEESIPAPAAATDAESSPVTRASSTESLMGGFERIDVSSNVESDIDDAEYID